MRRKGRFPTRSLSALVSAARRAFSRGLLHGYRRREEALQTVRGRIRFAEQLRRRFSVPLPIEVRYDEFTDDVLANRLVKAATLQLGGMRLRSSQAIRGLRWVAGIMENVAAVEFSPTAVPTVTFDRLNLHYRDVVELSRLILRHGAFEARRGTVQASGFLMDMNVVFQEFVTQALRDELGPSERVFPSERSVPFDAKTQRPSATGPFVVGRPGVHFRRRRQVQESDRSLDSC